MRRHGADRRQPPRRRGRHRRRPRFATRAEHPDLLWGLRGGGGNFGVVTAFEYRLHAVGPTVLAGPLYHALEDGPEVLRFYRDFIADAPDELTTIVNLRPAPPLPVLPPELHGRPLWRSRRAGPATRRRASARWRRCARTAAR